MFYSLHKITPLLQPYLFFARLLLHVMPWGLSMYVCMYAYMCMYACIVFICVCNVCIYVCNVHMYVVYV